VGRGDHRLTLGYGLAGLCAWLWAMVWPDSVRGAC
jgi:hypothetical protein